jgi:hypothetical protein
VYHRNFIDEKITNIVPNLEEFFDVARGTWQACEGVYHMPTYEYSRSTSRSAKE